MDNIPINQHLRNMSITLQMLMYPFQAESVAYCVLSAFGFDTSDYSFPYIAGWSSGKDMKELKESLETIRITSGLFIDEIQKVLEQKAA